MNPLAMVLIGFFLGGVRSGGDMDSWIFRGDWVAWIGVSRSDCCT